MLAPRHDRSVASAIVRDAQALLGTINLPGRWEGYLAG